MGRVWGWLLRGAGVGGGLNNHSITPAILLVKNFALLFKMGFFDTLYCFFCFAHI